MSEQFEFNVKGRVVRPGQKMHVAFEYWRIAGPYGVVERYHGDTVVLRSDNGAVPTVPVSALMWEPDPVCTAVEELREAGFSKMSFRDIDIWLAAKRSAGRSTEALAEAVEGVAIIESALWQAQNNGVNHAACPYVGDEAAAYVAGLIAAYQHAIEMICTGVIKEEMEKKSDN